MKANWTKEVLEECIKNSFSQKEVLELLGIRTSGSNFKTLKKYISIYDIDTSHFIKNYYNMISINIKNRKKTTDILTENSSYSRGHLKKRLINERILDNICCLCGQDENWKGIKISLILDHINGIHNDNRIHNLRIVCPNCNAGLDTFAGKNIKKNDTNKKCICGTHKNKKSEHCAACSQLKRRKVERPLYEALIEEVEEYGFAKTGRKYGVSDNTIRKWIKGSTGN